MEGIMAHGWSAALPGLHAGAGCEPGRHRCGNPRGARLAGRAWQPSMGSAGRSHRFGLVGGRASDGDGAVSSGRSAAGLSISGVFELGPIRDTYLNEKLKLTDAEIATLSPLRMNVVNKPLAIAYGTQELPAAGRATAATLHAMRAAVSHAPGALLPIAGTNHFTILDALSSPQRRADAASADDGAVIGRVNSQQGCECVHSPCPHLSWHNTRGRTAPPHYPAPLGRAFGLWSTRTLTRGPIAWRSGRLFFRFRGSYSWC